ncbi:MAG: S9 family peptidase [Bacteroidales bacterium]|nr:S9 family peptidase [Bacteroidales bacterium]
MNQKILVGVAMTLLLFSCGKKEQPTESVIGPKKLKIENGILTPEVLWSFGRLGETAVSPNGNLVAYTVSWYSIEENKSNSDIYIMNSDGSNKKQLTVTSAHEFNPVWVSDSQIAYLSTEGETAQIWTIDVDGNNKKKISSFESDINGFQISPKGDKILFISEVKIDKNTADVYPDLSKASGMIITDLMYRHWDTWEDGLYSHVFVADFTDGMVKNTKDIMVEEPYDSPQKPFGGMEEISWTPDGKQIAYTCKKLKGKAYAFSTNSDIYLYNLENGNVKNLTEGMPGYDKCPVFSPDGNKMIWLSMERAGFEADKDRLFVMDIPTGQKTYLTPNFDYSVSNIQWMPDGKTIYMIAGVEATFQIYRMDLTTNELKPITQGNHDYHSAVIAGNKLIGDKVNITKPAEIYSINPSTGKEEELSFINKDILDQLTMPNVEKRWVKSTDGKMVHSWIILPPNFDKTKKYPTLLFCEGGPQSPVSQFWSYRWNFSIMASNGYIVVAPSRRGTLTFGQAWTDQVSKDHGGQEMKDLLSSIDEISKDPWVDKDHLGAVGASYGGQTVFWLAGNHHKRFKALIAHCGVFNSEMEYLTTEEMFFDDWEIGGAPWESDNNVAMHSYAQSAHKFVKNWDTPILIIHGGKDFRIPYTQGMAAFNSAQILGVPSKFLFFPDENHWVLKPQNGILWQREFFGWLDKWLKVK